MYNFTIGFLDINIKIFESLRRLHYLTIKWMKNSQERQKQIRSHNLNLIYFTQSLLTGKLQQWYPRAHISPSCSTDLWKYKDPTAKIRLHDYQKFAFAWYPIVLDVPRQKVNSTGRRETTMKINPRNKDNYNNFTIISIISL